MRILFILVISILCFAQPAKTQTSKSKLEQVNAIIDYNNQNIHGLFIIHRLLELYNQDINQYVDLKGYKLNAFGNGDLPRDIFEDPKKEFYKVKTPRSIYKELQRSISPELRKYLEDFNQITEESNQLRWDVADFMEKSDFTKGENVQKVYEMLENCVSLFENYYALRQEFNAYRKGINTPNTDNQQLKKFISIANNLEVNISEILFDIRTNRTHDVLRKVSVFTDLIHQLKQNGLPFEEHEGNKESFKRILDRGAEFIQWASNYGNKIAIPIENDYYGPEYYYHNYKLLHRVNYSGVGIFFEMNELLSRNQVETTLIPEIPHYFKVIYPQKKSNIEVIEDYQSEKIVEIAGSQLNIIRELPKEFEGRPLGAQKLVLDGSVERTITIELYDHNLLDGDVVSLNFNGEWVIQNHSLEEEPIKLIVKANPEGKNYLLFQGEDEGSKPAISLAMKYKTVKRKREVQIALSKSKSKLIEFTFSK